MSIPALFIRRPVATSLVMFGILLFGLVGYRLLPVSDLPSVDYPTINVSAGLPGASPETMASAVATPLEKQFSTIPGVDSMTSVSSLGSAQITLQFTLDRDIDAAAADVQAAIAKTARQLPPDMPSPPTYNKVNPGGRARSFHRHVVAHAAAFGRGQLRRKFAGAAHLDDQRRGAGFRLWLAAIRRPHPGGPEQARGLRPGH